MVKKQQWNIHFQKCYDPNGFKKNTAELSLRHKPLSLSEKDH